MASSPKQIRRPFNRHQQVIYYPGAILKNISFSFRCVQSHNFRNNDRIELILVPTDVELNNDRMELILVPNDVELNNDRMELILVPNDVELNNDRMELILVPNDVECPEVFKCSMQ